MTEGGDEQSRQDVVIDINALQNQSHSTPPPPYPFKSSTKYSMVFPRNTNNVINATTPSNITAVDTSRLPHYMTNTAPLNNTASSPPMEAAATQAGSTGTNNGKEKVNYSKLKNDCANIFCVIFFFALVLIGFTALAYILSDEKQGNGDAGIPTFSNPHPNTKIPHLA